MCIRDRLELTQAQEALSQAQSGLSAAKSGKSQLESALDTTKTQKDTLKDNLNTTKETYEITKNEVYPQTDATYAAQLAQANVGLELSLIHICSFGYRAFAYRTDGCEAGAGRFSLYSLRKRRAGL